MSENLQNYLPARHKPENVNLKHKQRLGFQDRMALFITSLIGTMYAVYIFALSLLGWMLWQTYFDKRPFDPYPFAFLLFLGNIIQLLLMPLIMVGQNLQGRHSELRAEEEYKRTVSIYHDMEKILVQLNAQEKQLQDLKQLLSSRS